MVGWALGVLLCAGAALSLLPGLAAGAHADHSPPGAPCWIRGKVYADPDPDEVGGELARSPTCPADLAPRFTDHVLILATTTWEARIRIPQTGGWMPLAYRWGAAVATLGGHEVPVWWGPVGGI